MSCQQVPTTPAFNPYPRSVQVGEFEVAIGGGIWVAIRDAKKDVTWHIAMRPGKRRALDKENNPVDALIDQVEKIKASIRAKVEHPFRVIKRQFGYTKVRYRGLKKNTLQLKTLFALSNLCMVRHQLLGAQA